MEKKAALNKLAQAVRDYITAEQNYTKIAAAMQQLQAEKIAGIQKQAQMMDKVKSMLGMAQPAAKPQGMSNTFKVLSALGLLGGAAGGAALGSHMAGQENPNRAEDLMKTLGIDEMLNNHQAVGGRPDVGGMVTGAKDKIMGLLNKAKDLGSARPGPFADRMTQVDQNGMDFLKALGLS